ncbi:MAG: hypothetical protein NTX61_00680 [Bacteroidetes bacterium]|nr:hypothetical protein [Bacteroidota bacterium]
MNLFENKEPVFSITVEDLQIEAQEKIGRALTDEEILIAKKGLESGILTSIDIIYNTLFFVMIPEAAINFKNFS